MGMSGRISYEYELADAIDETILGGADDICLGPTDAAVASSALRRAPPRQTPLPFATNAARRFRAESWLIG